MLRAVLDRQRQRNRYKWTTDVILMTVTRRVASYYSGSDMLCYIILMAVTRRAATA